MRANFIAIDINRSKFTLLAILITLSNALFAQTSEFDRMLEHYHVQFKLPKGYVRTDSSVRIVNGKSGHIRAVAQSILKNKDGSMLIAISFQRIDTTRDEHFVKLNGDIWDRNRNFIPFDQKFETFPSKITHKIYNADISGTWNLVPFRAIPMLSAGENCRVIFIHKENLLDVEIYYYYANITQEQLNKRLKGLEGMLRFRKASKD